MKTLKHYLLVIASAILLAGCSKDKDGNVGTLNASFTFATEQQGLTARIYSLADTGIPIYIIPLGSSGGTLSIPINPGDYMIKGHSANGEAITFGLGFQIRPNSTTTVVYDTSRGGWQQ